MFEESFTRQQKVLDICSFVR